MLWEAGNIPPDIASTILDQAGYWTAVAAESSKSMETHAITLVPGDKVIDAIALGGSIVLEARAEFPGWENNVRSAALVLFYDNTM
eukprot:gene2631-5004_t